MALTLMDRGTCAYRIVVGAEADAGTHYAAGELAKYLEKIGGVQTPVVDDSCAPQDQEIVIGKTNREGAPCGANLKNDGYILKTVGERLFILGQNDRGNLYGVYGLLENKLGCRFFTASLERVPAKETVTLEELDETVIPPLEYRLTSWNEVSHNPVYAYKRGTNNLPGTPVTPMLNHSLCHTMFSYLSPDEYFDTHPEYFSMVNGVRIREETQLCLTNPEVKEIVKRNLRKTILEHPECTIFSVSQMDWYNPCQCPECARVDAEEGSHMGTMLRFVNECADFVAEEFPHVIIETLAYQYTRQAPKITKPRPNVCICLCTIECCFTHPMRQCHEAVRPFKYITDPDHPIQQDLVDWGKICKRLLVWDYTTNYRFYLAPMINLHVIQDNVKFFIENGVSQLFEQGNGQSISGEFGELRAYLLTKLMWEPDGDLSAWMDEFLDAYYGAGGRAIRAYIDLLADHVTRHHVHAGIYESPMDVIPNTLLPRMTELWDEAARLTQDDPEASAHVDRSRLQLEFVKHHRRRPHEVDFAEKAEELIESIKRNKVTYVQEIFESNQPQPEALERSFTQIRKGNLPDTWPVFWQPF